MDLATFNTNHGYVEALCRGLRQTLLTSEDYERLCACDNLEDLRSSLEETSYSFFLQDEPSPLSIPAISDKLRGKLADEMRHIRGQSVDVAVKFFDFVQHEKMIDNLILLIQGAVNKRSPAELISKCDPLGWFSEMRALTAVDVSAGYDDLYRCFIVDTPIGKYMTAYFEDLRLSTGRHNAASTVVQDMDLEILRNVMKKAWLEEFHLFTQTECNAETAAVMGHILSVEADLKTLTLTLNTLRSAIDVDRMALFPNFGYLYPEATMQLRKANNLNEVGRALDVSPTMLEIFNNIKSCYAANADEAKEHGGVAEGDGHQTLEDSVYRALALVCEQAFEPQMHLGVIHAITRLKEQEVRNILWISEMIVIGRKDKANEILPLFKPWN